MPVVEIDGRKIGEGYAPYVVAELSANHNGDQERAVRLLEIAAKAGADAVKLQTYTPDTMTLDHNGSDFVISDGLWKGRNLYELYQEASTPWDWHEKLFARAGELGLTVFSTPFDETSVDYLVELGAPAIKIASFEAIDIPLIEKASRTGKPIIISTGMANLGEISEAVSAARGAGCDNLVLLHCVSAYPTPSIESNLRTIPHLASTFGVVCGLSDHSLGTSIPVAGVALGACMVEKHFTVSRADGGPDSSFSLEPNELTALVSETRSAWEALGQVNYERTASERENVRFRRSLYVVEDISRGEPLTRRNVRAIRPGFGLKPKHLDDIIGRNASRDLKRGTALDWTAIS